MNKVKQILQEVLSEITPSKKELKEIKKETDAFISILKKEIKKRNIAAKVFIGGSLAKNTLIKKGRYDIDIFIRFSDKYSENDISGLTETLIKPVKKAERIHGSRDYFRIGFEKFHIEIIPVIEIKNPKDAKNITDLSYFHVNYIKKKLKEKKIFDEIKLAKAFCHASNTYGAESYIKGFSGYGLELLICKYKHFIKFIEIAAKTNEKLIIDLEKKYKDRHEVLMNMNSAKMHSPIILIDPTYRERNALAALSEETFAGFKKACKRFLAKPSKEAFEQKKTDFKAAEAKAKKNMLEFVLITAGTDKQEGDIAGSKLLKFYNHLKEELKKFYGIKDSGFEYDEKKHARFFFAAKNKKKILVSGPMANDKKNAAAFKKKHGGAVIKNKRLYAEEKNNLKLKNFILLWKEKNQRKVAEMDISSLEIFN
jgi:tRNA CCA-adding enzyme